MKNIIIIVAVIFFITNANSGENKYKGQLENCQDYKISPNFLICKISKAGSTFKKKLTTKKDGTNNFLGKWFGSKSFTEVIEK